jgi:hypothetical protein
VATSQRQNRANVARLNLGLPSVHARGCSPFEPKLNPQHACSESRGRIWCKQKPRAVYKLEPRANAYTGHML